LLPLHVSDARGVAPEEVYAAKKGRDSVVRGETELSQAERNRLRNAKKAARRKARKSKMADEKLISRLQPGLGLNNPYEKRKMREELQIARSRGKVVAGEKETEDNNYGKSGKFFRQMQNEVQQSVFNTNADTRKRKRLENRNSKSSAVKL
jgi:U3 small nucleolar RNA-associated protein MPP10